MSRAALALAFAQDTVAAALACSQVSGVTVVCNDRVLREALAEIGASVVSDVPDRGLNAAVRHAEALARHQGAGQVAALNGDLPCLRSADLARVLVAARRSGRRSFLSDSAGTGTTLLAAPRGRWLQPQFGDGSQARHAASGAWEIRIDGLRSARLDVDTPHDLDRAERLGLGAHTTGALRETALAHTPDAPATDWTEHD